MPDLSTLEKTTNNYAPFMSARNESHQTLKKIVEGLDETARIMGSEQMTHRDVVQEMKRDIKRTKADIAALRDGTHSMQTSFEDMSNRQATRSSDMNGNLKTLKDDIGKYCSSKLSFNSFPFLICCCNYVIQQTQKSSKLKLHKVKLYMTRT